MKTILCFSLIAIFAMSIFFITCSKESPTGSSGPQLNVIPNSFDFTKIVNVDTLIITNSGGGELSWEIADKPDWLNLSKSSGTITSNTDSLIIIANIDQAVGTYTGTININSNGGNKSVTISLNISLWTEIAPLRTGRLAMGTVAVDDKIYVIGGMVSETQPLPVLSTVEVYDPMTNTWIKKHPMPTASLSFGCAVVDGKIYAIGGGELGSYYLSTVQVYDPATNTWSIKKEMPTPRAGLAASTVNGKIYVIGGTNQVGGILVGISTVEEYDPVTDSWISKEDKPTPVWGLRTCVVNGKIYAIGGRLPPTAAVEVYDPITDSWDTSKNPMSDPKYSHSVCLFNEKIYVFGGWLNCSTGPM